MKTTLAGMTRSKTDRGYLNTMTVERDEQGWRWSVWAYDAGRSGHEPTAPLACRAARLAEDELRRTCAVARG